MPAANRIDERAIAPHVTFVPASELLENPKPLHWLVRGILLKGTMNTLIGAPNSFKSNLALDISACVATGKDWHGRAVAGGAVFFLAGEGNHGIARRLKAWSIAYDRELTGIPLFVSTGAVGLTSPLSAAALALEVKRLQVLSGHKPELVVIDTLARNFGTGDENSTSDMSAFVANLDCHIREQFRCAVLIVHHTGHADSNRGRGSGALFAATDSEAVCLRSENTVTVTSRKMKDAPEFGTMGFRIRIVELPWTGENGEAETSFVLEQLGEPPRKSALGVNQRAALAKLNQLYDEHRQHRVDTGHDPAGARVLIDTWRDAAGFTGERRKRWPEVRDALIRACEIELDSPYVMLMERPK